MGPGPSLSLTIQSRGSIMHYLHTMVRVTDVAQSLRFYCDGLGFKEVMDIVKEGIKISLSITLSITPSQLLAASY